MTVSQSTPACSLDMAPATLATTLPASGYHSGASCPVCDAGRLDYNGLLDLECPQCGWTLSGGAGCT
ncbi:MAG: hypothetical protein FJZ96_15975 [Chloroflexi bacterium]|nr:hypothetical protein [Chloroflexota bacterium]